MISDFSKHYPTCLGLRKVLTSSHRLTHSRKCNNHNFTHILFLTVEDLATSSNPTRQRKSHEIQRHAHLDKALEAPVLVGLAADYLNATAFLADCRWTVHNRNPIRPPSRIDWSEKTRQVKAENFHIQNRIAVTCEMESRWTTLKYELTSASEIHEIKYLCPNSYCDDSRCNCYEYCYFFCIKLLSF